jgi:hypothetical protein
VICWREAAMPSSHVFFASPASGPQSLTGSSAVSWARACWHRERGSRR